MLRRFARPQAWKQTVERVAIEDAEIEWLLEGGVGIIGNHFVLGLQPFGQQPTVLLVIEQQQDCTSASPAKWQPFVVRLLEMGRQIHCFHLPALSSFWRPSPHSGASVRMRDMPASGSPSLMP